MQNWEIRKQLDEAGGLPGNRSTATIDSLKKILPIILRHLADEMDVLHKNKYDLKDDHTIRRGLRDLAALLAELRLAGEIELETHFKPFKATKK